MILANPQGCDLRKRAARCAESQLAAHHRSGPLHSLWATCQESCLKPLTRQNELTWPLYSATALDRAVSRWVAALLPRLKLESGAAAARREVVQGAAGLDHHLDRDGCRQCSERARSPSTTATGPTSNRRDRGDGSTGRDRSRAGQRGNALIALKDVVRDAGNAADRRLVGSYADQASKSFDMAHEEFEQALKLLDQSGGTGGVRAAELRLDCRVRGLKAALRGSDPGRAIDQVNEEITWATLDRAGPALQRGESLRCCLSGRG
jgi:hypothetical protein